MFPSKMIWCASQWSDIWNLNIKQPMQNDFQLFQCTTMWVNILQTDFNRKIKTLPGFLELTGHACYSAWQTWRSHLPDLKGIKTLPPLLELTSTEATPIFVLNNSHACFTVTDRHKSHISFIGTERYGGHTSFIVTDRLWVQAFITWIYRNKRPH